MIKYFLQANAPWDVPTLKGEQNLVDEDKVNEAFEPANDAFSGLRELGDWVFDFFTDLFSGLFGTIM